MNVYCLELHRSSQLPFRLRTCFYFELFCNLTLNILLIYPYLIFYLLARNNYIWVINSSNIFITFTKRARIKCCHVVKIWRSFKKPILMLKFDLIKKKSDINNLHSINIYLTSLYNYSYIPLAISKIFLLTSFDTNIG